MSLGDMEFFQAISIFDSVESELLMYKLSLYDLRKPPSMISDNSVKPMQELQ
jgi:hypothetical protein